MVIGSEKNFFHRRYTGGQQTHEKILSITNHQGNKNLSHNKVLLHTCQNCYYPKDKTYHILAQM